MSKLQVWFNGIEITQYIDITMGKDELLIPEQNDDTVSPGNMIGTRFRSTKVVKRTIETPFIMTSDLKEKTEKLKSALYVSEPAKLAFSDHIDRYWIAMPEGPLSFPQNDTVSLTGTIKWLCYDPYSYAVEEDEFAFADNQKSKDFSVNFAGKIFNSTKEVPHKIYTGTEPITVAMASPASYKTELNQLNYSKLAKRDGRNAKVSTSSILTNKSVGNFERTADSNEDGALDSVELIGDTIKFSGWFATNESTTKKIHWIIVNNPEWSVEYGRVKVDLVDRPDVARVRPNIANSGKCGFVGSIPYTEEMRNKRLRVFFRYEDDSGSVTDWSAWLTTTELWRQSMPHMMIKFDVLQAMEQAEPGFWQKYGVYGRSEQLEWLKDAVNSVKFKAWAYGKGYSGNNITMKFWDNDTSWDGLASHNKSEPSLLERDFTEPANFFQYVEAGKKLFQLTK